MFVILHSSCKRNEFNNISFLNLTGELLHVLIDSVILILHYFYYCIVSYCTLILSDIYSNLSGFESYPVPNQVVVSSRTTQQLFN